MARKGHGVIQVDNEFIVVGGCIDYYCSKVPASSCKLNGQSMTCTSREPQLSQFEQYAELVLVP